MKNRIVSFVMIGAVLVSGASHSAFSIGPNPDAAAAAADSSEASPSSSSSSASSSSLPRPTSSATSSSRSNPVIFLDVLPNDLLKEIARFNESNVENGLDPILGAIRLCHGNDEKKETEKEFYQEKVKKIEAIMRKFGSPIPLSTGGWIEPAAPSQELWVEVMGVNPSHFKEAKYCPDTHKTVIVRGSPVEMCPDSAPERIAAKSDGRMDSDEEFIKELNDLYAKADFPTQFRRHRRAEYNWADTVNGSNPKVASDLIALGKAMPYWGISDKDPKDHSRPSPSGEAQTRSMLDNEPNELGFRRSGVWEWTEDMESLGRGLVGGSWYSNPESAVSGYRDSSWPDDRDYNIGPARLVRVPR